MSASHKGLKKDELEQERWSIHTPPRHYAYVPSVTLTPTTICVNPLKLVKTNRVLRETQFGGNLMFALVDVKDENGTMDLFPHDCTLIPSDTRRHSHFSRLRSSLALENRNAAGVGFRSGHQRSNLSLSSPFAIATERQTILVLPS